MVRYQLPNISQTSKYGLILREFSNPIIVPGSGSKTSFHIYFYGSFPQVGKHITNEDGKHVTEKILVAAGIEPMISLS